jgi:phasin
MARNTHSENFEIPPEMRAFAEKSFEQARQAFDSFLSAASRTVSTLGGQAETARKGARGVGEKAISFAEQNIANAFEHAQKLVRAKDVDEVLKLQAEYIKGQMEALSEQAKELGESTSKTVKNTTRPRH